MHCDILNSKQDLGHYVEAQMHMFIDLANLCRCRGANAHFTVLLGCLMFGMPVEMHPIAYREPRWGFVPREGPKMRVGLRPPPITPPYDAQLKYTCVVLGSLWGRML